VSGPGQGEALWQASADLVVLGAGAAGLTAALVAAGGGAKVVLLEKTALIGGTAALSGGAHWVPANHHMDEVGVEDSPADALAYLRACAGANTDDEILVTLAEQGALMLARLESLGVPAGRPWPAVGGTWDYRPWLPGARQGGRALLPPRFRIADLGGWASRLRVATPWYIDMIDYYAQQMYLAPPRPGAGSVMDVPQGQVAFAAAGTALVGQLLAACLAQGVEIVVEARGEALVMEAGRVAGVRARREGRPWAVEARRGVLVATGGYGGSEELKRLWLRRRMAVTCELPENEGDGHLMGMAVGAQVANLGDAWWSPFIVSGVDDPALGRNITGSREDRTLPHTLIVNRQGRRFINESVNYADFHEGFGANSGAAPANAPAWLIFDRRGVERYAMLAAKVPPGEPPEWLTVAGSLAELAQTLGIEAAALGETVARFNAFAREGRDFDFQRGENAWDIGWGDPANLPNPSLGPLEKPPFYAVEVLPGALATKGGLRVNGQGEVLAAAPPHAPIPGLYAAGNCSNGATAGAYPGPGATLGAAMTFGYVVGRRVAEGATAALRPSSGRGPPGRSPGSP
jgi:3-oxosteroid 1-dehydrogenase